MSEKLLRALMQLFAIVGKIDGYTQNNREIVYEFLKNQLNNELANQYLQLYEEFVETENVGIKKPKVGPDGQIIEGRASVRDSLKILNICSQINEELTQKQKYIVLTRIIEFITNENASKQEVIEVVDTIAISFNISEEKVQNLKSFIFNPSELKSKYVDLLLINDEEFAQDLNFLNKHLRIKGLSGEIYIFHLKAVNIFLLKYFGSQELFLNGQLIKKDRSYVFANGSNVRGNKLKLPIYYSDVSSVFSSKSFLNTIKYTADNISYRFYKDKIALQPLSFKEESGKLIGIMGSSGSGKSTLLNVLNGKFVPATGSVTINGIDLHKNPEKLEGIIGYVSQDDFLIEDLTVYQNLFFNAELCFDGYPKEIIDEKVNEILMDTGLYEIRNLIVGSPLDKKISGGQRKRLNIALELIREPEILFVDEPTSGLSSRGSLQIMDLLKEQTLKGKLVFVIIHQPSSDIFLMFDNLLILDHSYPVYYGHPSDSLYHFKSIVHHAGTIDGSCSECGNVNSEVIFDIIESKIVDEYGELTPKRKFEAVELYEKYLTFNPTELKKETEASVDVSQITKKSIYKIPSLLKQMKVFIKRDVLAKKANTQYLLITFLQAPALAILLSLLVKNYSLTEGKYWYGLNENIPAYLFMSVIVALFLGLSISAQEIFNDREILKREEFLNLSWLVYLFSKTSILFVISAVQAISFTLIGNYILEIHGLNFEYWLILFTVSCVSNTMGLIISSSFNSAINIYILVPILLIPQLLLSGVIVKFDKLNPKLSSPTEIPIMAEMAISRWAFEAITVTLFEDNEYEKEFFDIESRKSKWDYKKNFWIPKLLSNLELVSSEIEQKKANKELIDYNVQLIYNEITTQIETDAIEVLFGQHLSNFLKNPDEQNITAVRKGLNSLNQIYLDKSKTIRKVENIKISSFHETIGNEGFIELKNKNHNAQLEQLVKKQDDSEKIIEYKGKLFQKIDPIFQEGTGKYLKAPFFTNTKKLGTQKISTFWANICVLWVFGIVQFVILYSKISRIILVKIARIYSSFSLRK